MTCRPTRNSTVEGGHARNKWNLQAFKLFNPQTTMGYILPQNQLYFTAILLSGNLISFSFVTFLLHSSSLLWPIDIKLGLIGFLYNLVKQFLSRYLRWGIFYPMFTFFDKNYFLWYNNILSSVKITRNIKLTLSEHFSTVFRFVWWWLSLGRRVCALHKIVGASQDRYALMVQQTKMETIVIIYRSPWFSIATVKTNKRSNGRLAENDFNWPTCSWFHKAKI